MSQRHPERLVAYDTHPMASQTYYGRGHRASSHTQSEYYSESNFLKSLPDEDASLRQVMIWIDSGDKSRLANSDPGWKNFCNFDGWAINRLSLNVMLDRLVGWGMEHGSAEWLVERIVFARGLRVGVKEYLTYELRKDISPEFIAGMRTEVQEQMKDEIRREFGEHIMNVMREEVKVHLIEEIKEQARFKLDEEDVVATIKADVVEELRDQIRNSFDDDLMEQMKQDVKKQVKLEVQEVLKFKFRGSIMTGMKYEIMEDMKEGLVYNLSEEDESSSKQEPANTGRGRKRRK